TMFWPTRLTYSTTTGSVTMWADFSISMEYCLPMPISELMEYQLPRPRPPMLRVPMVSTSSSLPFLMWGSRASPGEGSGSDLAVVFGSGFAGVLEPGFALPLASVLASVLSGLAVLWSVLVLSVAVLSWLSAGGAVCAVVGC